MWVSFINFFNLSMYLHRFSFIKLESVLGNSSNSFFILLWSFLFISELFSLMLPFLFYCYTLDKKVNTYYTISLSRYEQVCLIRLCFEKYFSHYEHWTDKQKYLYIQLTHITNWFILQNIFLKRNKYSITSNIGSSIAYYYTFYTFKYLIDKNWIFCLIITFHFLISTLIIYG